VLVVATANVLGTLGRRDARAAVAAVLDHEPDLVALQEWHPWRAGLLRGFRDYAWHQPALGGCATGARRTRFERVVRGSGRLSPPGRADRSGRLLGLEPPRRAGLTVQRDFVDGTLVSLIAFHLASQVQGPDHAFRADRPRLVARHQLETAALLRLVDESLAAGLATYACGDSNFHGFRIPGLVSAWDARPDAGGTLGPARRVDDVHGPTAPSDVVTVRTASDHLAVVATYA
jgi:hypothetical protein